VTGVQTCALPIFDGSTAASVAKGTIDERGKSIVSVICLSDHRAAGRDSQAQKRPIFPAKARDSGPSRSLTLPVAVFRLNYVAFLSFPVESHRQPPGQGNRARVLAAALPEQSQGQQQAGHTGRSKYHGAAW